MLNGSLCCCTGVLRIGLLPGGGGKSGAMVIVTGVAGRLPERPLDMMAIVELREGVGETLLTPGRAMFGGELARAKLGAVFCVENNDGLKAKDVGCEACA